jgi:hypothetical protein
MTAFRCRGPLTGSAGKADEKGRPHPSCAEKGFHPRSSASREVSLRITTSQSKKSAVLLRSLCIVQQSPGSRTRLGSNWAETLGQEGPVLSRGRTSAIDPQLTFAAGYGTHHPVLKAG